MKPVHMFVRPDRSETAFHCFKDTANPDLSQLRPRPFRPFFLL